ncbi:MFS transporter [Nocardia thailandica]
MSWLRRGPGDVRDLTLRAVLFRGTRDLLPVYGLYGVLFADHGLDAAQISLLFALWSLTAFFLEVPSGAWADTVSRRGLLVLSALLQASTFTVWALAPSFAGFALGFVLWGVAGALESGTFEALVYDELVTRGETASYARIMGYARAAQEISVLVAIVSAAPLYALGGYALVGWVSVGVACVHVATALTLPGAPRAVSASVVEDLEDGVPEPVAAPHGYLSMLRAGVGEALRVRRVRRGVLLGALLYGMTAFDEYFGLLAVAGGASTAASALLLGVAVTGSLAGSLLAGRAEALAAGRLSALLVLAGGTFIGGCLLVAAAPGSAYGTALLWPGFVGIAIGYGIDFAAEVVASARLQDAIEGPARATVTSVSGLLSEIVALGIFGFVALTTTWWTMPVTVGALGALLLLAAALTPSWLPPRRAEADRTPATAADR